MARARRRAGQGVRVVTPVKPSARGIPVASAPNLRPDLQKRIGRHTEREMEERKKSERVRQMPQRSTASKVYGAGAQVISTLIGSKVKLPAKILALIAAGVVVWAGGKLIDRFTGKEVKIGHRRRSPITKAERRAVRSLMAKKKTFDKATRKLGIFKTGSRRGLKGAQIVAQDDVIINRRK